MQRKAAIQIAFFSLLLASGSICTAGKASKPSDDSGEQPLSYKGQVAVTLAQELIDEQKYDEALKQAEIAVRSDSKSGTPYMVKAFILGKMGDPKKADSAYAKAVSLSPKNGYIRNAYATHLCMQHQYAEADQNFLLATLDVNYPLAAQALDNAAQCAYDNKNLLVAEARARAALELDQDSLNSLATMSRIKFDQSNFFEARAFIQRFEALEPLNASLLELAQQIEKSAGDDRAAAQYQKRLEIVLQTQIQPPTGEGQKKP